jgi:hypothetical protein
MDENKEKSRAIIDIKDEWPWWKVLGAQILNGIPIVIWAVIAYLAMIHFGQNSELVHNRDMTMNISIYTTVWGVISEIAFLGLVSWLFHLFSYERVKNGPPMVQAACFIFWGFLALAGAMIISAGIR